MPERSHPFLRHLVIFLILIATSVSGYSGWCQQPGTLPVHEETLQNAFDEIFHQPNSAEMLRKAEAFASTFHRVLSDPDSFSYPFDSLPTISRLRSPDNTFRIYTWNIPLSNGTQRYYGILQQPKTASSDLRLYRLNDHQTGTPASDTTMGGAEEWFGAVYYQLIPVSLSSKQRLYTVLGWRGVNRLLTGKIVDVLWFDQEETPRFGFPFFCRKPDQRDTRLFFWHSSRVTIVLRYEEQYRRISNNWNSRKGLFEPRYKKEFMIVCDRLVPENPELQGLFEYYVPIGDQLDGYIFQHNCWELVTDIEVRNPSRK